MQDSQTVIIPPNKTILNLLKEVTRLKEQGNQFVTESKFSQAEESYQQGLKVCNSIENYCYQQFKASSSSCSLSSTTTKLLVVESNPQEQNCNLTDIMMEIMHSQRALSSNLLLVLYKLRLYQKVLDFCSQLLSLDNHQRPPNSVVTFANQHSNQDSINTTTNHSYSNDTNDNNNHNNNSHLYYDNKINIQKLELFRSDPKIWYRRAQAKEALNLYTEAELDFIVCEKLLFSRKTTTTSNHNNNASPLKINHNYNDRSLVDTQIALKRIRGKIQEQQRYSSSLSIHNNIHRNDDSCNYHNNHQYISQNHQPLQSSTTNTSSLEEKSNDNNSPTANNNYYHHHNSLNSLDQNHSSPSTEIPYTTQSRNKQIKLNHTRKRPTPAKQKDYVITLLSQSPKSRNEAFFLINYDWWKCWCRYVNFYYEYEYTTILNQREQIIHDKKQNYNNDNDNHHHQQHQQQLQQLEYQMQQQDQQLLDIETQRSNILALLPYGSCIPKPFQEEKRRKPNNDDMYDSDVSDHNDDDSSVLSSSSHECDEENDDNNIMDISNCNTMDSCNDNNPKYIHDSNQDYSNNGPNHGKRQKCETFIQYYGPRPGVINNSKLLLYSLPPTDYPYDTNSSNGSDGNGKGKSLTSDDASCSFYLEWRYGKILPVMNSFNLVERNDDFRNNYHSLLQPNLIRGYHFEIVPREVYAAFRSWYGECTPPILRRVTECNRILSIHLYPEFHHEVLSSINVGNAYESKLESEEIYFCGACGSTKAMSRCRNCHMIHYCGRECQLSHWQYHKSLCKAPFLRQEIPTPSVTPRNSLFENPKKGRVGLNNLGNTCFMNSALQCLSHSMPLTRHFLNNRYKFDLNTSNPLGSGGKLANAYATTIKELWMNGNKTYSISPTALKRSIALFAPRFAGTSQHDSQEFLAFLLDGLHEDLNKIQNPPYIEKVDVRNGEELTIAGVEAWDAHCLRNKSIVQDTFYGQFKSTCVCPVCEQISVSFDSFNHISLEIPQLSDNQRTVPIILFHAPKLNHTKTRSPPVRYAIAVQSNSQIKCVKLALSKLCGIPFSRLALCDVYDNSIYSIYNDDQKISVIDQEGVTVAYEIDPHSSTTVHMVGSHVITQSIETTESTSSPRRKLFGYPFLLSFNMQLTCEQIWDYVINQIADVLEYSEERDLFISNLRHRVCIRFTDNNGTPKNIHARDDSDPKIQTAGDDRSLLPKTNHSLVSYLGEDCTECFLFVVIEWNVNNCKSNNLIDVSMPRFAAIVDHPSLINARRYQQSLNEDSFTLQQCFENFTRPERLDEDNKWYCANCKAHVRAFKTMDLWKLPNVMIVHLKRFEYKHALRRDKLDTFINYPIDHLDMSEFCASSKRLGNDFVDSSVPAIYDLFAVTNHYGRMGFGHYNAFARRWNERGIEQKWICFDDATVKDQFCSTRDIVTSSAYVLFYRRRVFA